MRLISLLTAALLSTSLAIAQAPAVKPPPAAQTHLTKTYPGAVVEKWKQGGKHFKADFKVKGTAYRAYYTPDGAWVRTEHNVKKSALPTAVTAALKTSKYASWKIGDVEERATTEHAKLYKVKVETELKKAELLFTPEGKLLQEEEKAKKSP